MKKSVCSAKGPVRYYWRETVDRRHLDATLDELMKAISGPHRHENPYRDETNRAEFRRVLKLAQKGKLVPGDHVKTVQYEPRIDMFEMRWQHVEVVPVDRVSGMLGDPEEVAVRLYYVEEGEPWIVGLYAHEKAYCDDPKETTEAQNVHIGRAVDHAQARAPQRWGVPELSDQSP
ncbi:hypothetical protein [Ornithinimicrobium sp. CNJ-824]|uniref:hypothetical protein n=1 Tax=Ornithinimicrobium sp. CNJ-824 TaxID=1904966 RepID=UPI00118020E1|nr:hypothetical protein [Ornithinimicrobium sp. CNJ-824]